MRTSPPRTVRILCAALACAALAAPPLAADEVPPAADPANAAPTEPAKPPISRIEGAAPTETPAERMERFKREKGAGTDKPFEGFATQAELEMQRQRDAAIGSATVVDDIAAEQSVEDFAREGEKLQDRLARVAPPWGGTLCSEQEPDWHSQEDWTRYRRLERGDFLSEQEGRMNLTVVASQGRASAYLALLITCVVTPNVIQPEPNGLWVASLSNVRYMAVLSRESSYLIADAQDYALAHEQLHFEIAHQLARWLTKNQETIRVKLTRQGRSKEEALGLLQLELGKHLLAVQRDVRALETAYDRETEHGLDSERQTQWNFRIQDGLEAMAKSVRLESRAAVK